MLNFVIPLRSARTTKDWPAIQRLLGNTLRSVDNQLCRSFRCFVVCHETPSEIDIPKSFEIIEAPFDPPIVTTDDLSSESALFEMHSDKGRKLIHGLSIARKDPESFVMFLDADDLVSNRLAEFAFQNPARNGWYFDLGYRWNHQTPRLLFPRKNFFHECGSCYMLKSKLAPFPEYVDFTKDLNDYFIRRYVVHAYVGDNMVKLGLPLGPLPFPGAIYTFNEQNFFAESFRGRDSSIRSLARILFKGKHLNGKLKSEFCFPTPSSLREKT